MIYVIIIILILILIKGIFSAADTAFTYINRAEIKQLSKTDKRAQKIRKLMEDSNKFFGTTEVVINMCELFAAAIVSVSFLEIAIAFLEKIGLQTIYAVIISVLAITAILAYIMLVFGGILPKRIARNNPKKTAYKLIPILWIVSKLNYPFERLVDYSTDLFSKIFGISQDEEKMTEKQLKLIMKQAKEDGVLETLENRILINTIKANNIIAGKIMKPIEKAYCININDEIENILKGIKENKYSRIPVYEENLKNIIGIFHIKDTVIKNIEKGITSKKQIKEVMRNPIYIGKDEKIFTAFKTLQRNNQMIGIVKDSNDIPVGLITMEDILERLVGKIFDEDDIKE